MNKYKNFHQIFAEKIPCNPQNRQNRARVVGEGRLASRTGCGRNIDRNVNLVKFSERDARLRIDFRVTENADARATPFPTGLSWWEKERQGATTTTAAATRNGGIDASTANDNGEIAAEGKADGDEHRGEMDTLTTTGVIIVLFDTCLNFPYRLIHRAL